MRKISKSVRREAFEYASIMATVEAQDWSNDLFNRQFDAAAVAGVEAAELAEGACDAADYHWRYSDDDTEDSTTRRWGEAAAMLLEGWSPS